MDLKNTTLRVGAVELYPFFTFNTSVGVTKYSGVCFEILKALSKSLNFNFNISKVDSGGRLVNGSWTFGIISEVNKTNFDIGLDAVTQNFERYTAVDFTFPFMSDRASILSPAPIKESKTLAVIEVFSPQVWLLIALCVLTFSPLMKVVEKIRLRINPNLPESERGTLWTYLWVVVCLTLLKGLKSPFGSAPRILILFWSFMVFTLFTMYSGMLLGLLSYPRYSQPINSLYDLVDRKYITWGAFSNAAPRKFVEDSQNPPFPKVKRGFKDDLMPKSIMQAAEFLRRGNYALISDEIIFANIRLTEIKRTRTCPYYVSSQYLYVQWYSLIVPKDSTYLPLLNTVIQRLTEGGIIDFWLHTQLNKKLTHSLDLCRSSAKAAIQDHAMQLTDVQGAFIVLVFGVLLALGGFIVENIANRKPRNVAVKRRIIDVESRPQRKNVIKQKKNLN